MKANELPDLQNPLPDEEQAEAVSKKPYAPPCIKWEQAFVALASASDPCLMAPPGTPGCDA